MQKSNYKKYFDFDSIIEEISLYLPTFDVDNFKKAFLFAERAHRNQFRKDGITPYIVHPISVVKILSKIHADEDLLISALLHDVPEDTSHDIEEVREVFGHNISFLVNGITKLSKVQYQNNMPARSIGSLKKLFLHSAKDLRIIIIKLADRLHNMKTLEHVSQEKRIRIAKETLEIYVPIANLLGIQEFKYNLEDLCFKHLLSDQFNKINEIINKQSNKQDKSIENFIKSNKKLFKKAKLKVKIHKGRTKLYGIYKKLKKTNRDCSHIDKRIRIDIIVESVQDCYKILGLLHGKYTPKTDKFRDYIAKPKINGYKSLHTVVFGESGVITEIHIATEDMFLEREYGIISGFFKLDKKNRNNSLLINSDKRAEWFNKIVNIEKKEKNGEFMEDLKKDILQERIFVFTPKGETIDLPKNASAIDFAYEIHSQLGHHAQKVNLNGHIRSITSPLKSGDVVRVISSKNSHPELYWLNFVKTAQAKSNIKNYFKKTSKDKKIQLGAKLLQRKLDIVSVGPWQSLNFKKIKLALEKTYDLGLKNWNDIFIAIGSGDLKSIDILNILNNKNDSNKKIVNYDFFENDKRRGALKVSLKVFAKNRFGLLNKISDIACKYSVDMDYFKGQTLRSHNHAKYKLNILVDNIDDVNRIFDEMEQIEDVIYVQRVTNKGLILFYVLSFSSAIAWVSHYILLDKLWGSQIHQNHKIIFNALIYSAFFGLLFSVIFLTSVLKKYFPLIRNKNYLWFTSFTLLTIAGLSLYYELSNKGFNMNNFYLLIGVLGVYTYLIIDYIRFRQSIIKLK